MINSLKLYQRFFIIGLKLKVTSTNFIYGSIATVKINNKKNKAPEEALLIIKQNKLDDKINRLYNLLTLSDMHVIMAQYSQTVVHHL